MIVVEVVLARRGRAPVPGEDSLEQVTPWRGFLIGLGQSISMWPGSSRSMCTIVTGQIVGLSTATAAEFSFLLGLPTLGAACVHDLAGNLRHGGPSMSEQLGAAPMALGFVVATVAAVIAVRWLVSFLTRHGLAPFGWYRLVLSAAFAALIIAGVAG